MFSGGILVAGGTPARRRVSEAAGLGGLAGLYDRLLKGEGHYTFAALVPLISLSIIVLLVRYTRIPLRPPRITGLAVLVFGLLVYLVGCRAAANFVCCVSLLAVLAGLVLSLWGWPALRRLSLGIAFLVFMMPPSEPVIASLSTALKLLATDWAVRLANLVGLIVDRSGTRILLPEGKELTVGDVCSGMRTLNCLLAFSVLYAAYVSRLGGPWRLIPLAASMPVAVASNVLRIVAVIVVADIWNAETATGFFHDFSNLAIPFLALGLMFGLEKTVLWFRKVGGRPAEVPPLFHDVRLAKEERDQWNRMALASGGWAGAVAGALLVTAGWTGAALGRFGEPARDRRAMQEALPKVLVVDGQALPGKPVSIDEDALLILKTPDYTSRTYIIRGGPANVTVLFSRLSRWAPHPPEACIRHFGAELTYSGSIEVRVGPGRQGIECREPASQSGPDRAVCIVYVYGCGRTGAGALASGEAGGLGRFAKYREIPVACGES